MLTEAQRQALVHSFKLVVPIADTAADLFYRRLFELQPSYRDLFSSDMTQQKRKLVTMLAFIVKSLDYVDAQWNERVEEEQDLFYVVLALGRRHATLYKIPEDSYGPVGEALLWCLDYGLGEAFTSEVREAWTQAYSALVVTMKMGASSSVDVMKGKMA